MQPEQGASSASPNSALPYCPLNRQYKSKLYDLYRHVERRSCSSLAFMAIDYDAIPFTVNTSEPRWTSSPSCCGRALFQQTCVSTHKIGGNSSIKVSGEMEGHRSRSLAGPAVSFCELIHSRRVVRFDDPRPSSCDGF